ncbi:transcription initiation factor TFIID subunit 7 [Histomonas meleagridis]|uniref:transcription initiation factor TFIID subunit 7 n=1 Tax=Histomonas meleagridis TaxID=135588 RepID=UPI00355AA3AC|nr:transcription initiation factor TFIID subunit 7 [Histomonas meleagridis]KAH0801356.1 transcription initiation factor TFIID subunit 7 [Histomonas meleagridis]
MSKSKAKSKPSTADDNEPYYHPVLEEQMIIRFPKDIAASLTALMEDDEPFKDFTIKFVDEHHAVVKIFDQTLKAVLVSLPTIVETHRTVDGSHLFKSADIGEMLIVYHPNSEPEDINEGYLYEHGLTPPTKDIVSKRKAKQETARANQPDSSSLEGIDYWEMVEIQLSALLSKDKSTKPYCRHEFLEEPDIDAVELEKILRRDGHEEFKGYSGIDIPEEEIQSISPENEPIVHIPQEIIDEIAPKEETEEETEAEITKSDEDEVIQDQPKTEATSSTELEPQSEVSESSSYYEEEEEEEDIPEMKTYKDLLRQYEVIQNDIKTMENNLFKNKDNERVKNIIENSLEDKKRKMADIEAQLHEAERALNERKNKN